MFVTVLYAVCDGGGRLVTRKALCFTGQHSCVVRGRLMPAAVVVVV